MMQQQMQSAGMTGGIFSDMQMQREGPGLRISSPAMHSSPVLRSSSGTMSGGSGGSGMNPMLRQMEHQSMAMQPSLPQASAQYGLPGAPLSAPSYPVRVCLMSGCPNIPCQVLKGCLLPIQALQVARGGGGLPARSECLPASLE